MNKKEIKYNPKIMNKIGGYDAYSYNEDLHNILSERYLYYTIDPAEQLFKQLSGFLFFLQHIEKRKGMTLVLPRFELKGKKIPYGQIFDLSEVEKNFSVISFYQFQKVSKSNQDINKQTEAWIDGFWQLPYNVPNYMKYRKCVKYQKRYYKDVDTALTDVEPYISVHWRQDDFLRIRPHVVMSKEQLVEDTIEKLKVHNVNKVYISTDCKDEETLKYIDEKLPTFKYKTAFEVELDPIEFAVLESIVCSRAVYFTGTHSSLYSVNIVGERMRIGYKDEDHEIKNINEGKTNK